MHFEAPARPRIKVVVQPGPEHISDQQRATLKALVDDIVKAEIIKRTPKTHATVWSALNKKLRAPSYHLIRAVDYARAETYLRQWIGRLSAAKSAPSKIQDWRKRKYAYIHTNVKQIDAEPRLRALLVEEYGGDSLTILSDAQLTAVYQRVAGWKRAGRVQPGKA